ncbi:MAG: hypothetical protein GPJ54_16730 [Candidatus Heimdallarchaeota archaeon]|nr:hypothetical protein [Candidatus Heimdallarchaeota archaeon]
MLSWEIIKEVENQFLRFKNHSAFIIRERLYKGSNVYGNGLQPVHTKMREIIVQLSNNPVPEDYLEIKKDEFSNHVKKIDDSIQMLIFMVENEGETNGILKLFTVIEMEIQELAEFFSLGFTFDPSTIKSAEDLTNQRIFELGLKIDDNFSQISSSNEWRLRKASPQNEQTINFEELVQLIENAKSHALTNVSEDYLALLSIMAIKIRDSAAADLSKLKECLLFYITTCKILGEDLSFEFEGVVITSKYVKDDIEHKINMKSLAWLVKVHNSITEEYPEEKYTSKFTTLLYKLSRDVREEFLWTMLRLAREQRNEELEDISIAYATLASMLLSVNNNLIEAGMDDLASAITQADEIKALDVIDDLAELYSLDNLGTDKLVNAIRKQLDSLKLLAYQIIQMEDIRPTFQMIVQFTDMEANFADGLSLEEYIESLGK